jgi:hypothetical protein
MTLATGESGRGGTPSWKRHPAVVVGAISIGIVLVWVALPSPWGVGVFEPQSQPKGGVLGPYTLNATNYWSPVELSFSQCAFVVVHWRVATGGPTNFTVSSGEFEALSHCIGPGPSNESCLPLGCSANGPAPVCFEVGVGGTCSFTSTQSQYAFYVFEVVSGSGYGPVPTSESATVMIDYS